MNHVFRVIWSHVQNAWVVVSELATRRGKRSGGVDARVAAEDRMASPEPLAPPPSPWPLRAGILFALTALYAPARAANLYWDVDGNGTGLGGTGTWNGSNLFWNSSSTGTSGTMFAWNNAALDDAFFGGTAGTVTLGSPITLHNLNFTSNGYILTGSTLTLAGTNPTLSYTGGNTTTINSVLAGSNGLTVNGGSTNGWIVLGGTNTLTGGITVNSNARLVGNGSNSFNGAANVVTVNSGGVLQVNHANAFGGNTAASNLVINNGGNLWLGGVSLTHNITAAGGGTININQPFADLTSTWIGNLVLTADTTLQVTNTGANGNTVFAGNLTDTGANKLSLVLNEGGSVNSSLFLDGTNSFTGGITVNAGQLVMRGTDAAAAAAGNVVTLNGGFLRVEGDAFGGDTDAAQLILNGGVLRVETNNTLTHDVTLTGGDRYIDGLGNATWSGTSVLTADTLLHLGVGGHTLTVRGPLQDTGSNALSVTTEGGNVRFNGPLSFSGNLTLAGGVTWFDGGNYTYSGDTIINNNTQLVLNSTSLSPNSNIRYEGLNNGNVTVIYGTNARPTITMLNGAGGGQLRWAGTGGFYALNNQSDVTVNLGGAGATLTWNDGIFVPDGHALILGTNVTGTDARQVDFQNGIDLSGGLRDVRANNGNIADHAKISGVLTGTGGLHVIGNGALELTAANNYSGATVIGDDTNDIGYLILGSSAADSLSSNFWINGANGIVNGGMITMTAASGDFTNALGAGANQVQWIGSGGFGAIGGERHVNIGGAGATLAWGSGGFVSTGEMLRFGGRFTDSTVVWDNGINLGATTRAINVNEGVGLDRDVRLQGVIEGAGGLDLMGQGDVDLFGLNTYSGTTRIGGGDVTSATDGMYVYFNTFADIGTASSFGTGSTIELGSHNGAMVYTGTGPASGNRNLALAGRSGSLLHLFNRGGGALEIGGDIATTISGASNELRVGGTFVSVDANNDGVADNPNILSGVISDGAGTTALIGTQCSAGSVWRLSGANTFTGRFLLNTCTFEATTLGNIGEASSVGVSGLLADFRSGGGTLRYVGSGESTDRLFWSWSNAHLESSGSGPLSLTNSGLIVDRNGMFVQSLGGTNTGDNLFAPTLINGSTLAETHGTNNVFHLLKEGRGLWALVTDNNAQTNAYVGNTRIIGGALRADDAGAITGGFGVASNHGTAGSPERSSLILFEGVADGTGGVLGLTAASGGFFRGTSTRGLSFIDNNGTTVGADPDGTTGPLPAYGTEALDDDNYEQGVRWTGSGGFAAWDGTQTVNLFGDAREVAWGSGGFVPTNHQLVFGYQTANGTVDFRNGINLGSGTRTVHVNDGTATRDAIMSGVLRSTSVFGGLTKTGTGSLTLTANNTYTGTTTVSAGTLEVGDGGTTGTLGSGAQVVVAAGANLISNRADNYTLTQNVIGDGTLIQRGAGTTTMATNSNIDHVVLEQGTLATPTTLLTDDIRFTDAGGATLQVRGTVQTSTGTSTQIIGGIANDTVRIDAGGVLRANGSLGDGSDTLDVFGTLDTGVGSLDLGAGNDNFLIHDNTNVVGPVLGGVGTDVLDANIATTANLDVVQGFETLTKTGTGTLQLNGPGASDFSTVDVLAGTLDVDAGAAVVATPGGVLNATVANGATLNVDGAFGCGTGNDSISIAGNVTGGGTIDQCGGDDTLILRDGANVGGYTGVFNGGAHTAGIGDRVQLDVAGALTFAATSVTNYENLLKTNTGSATLVGNHTYSGSTELREGTLDVDGTLTTPVVAMTNTAGTTTLNIDGTVQAGGATQAFIAGGDGSNRINVNAGAIFRAFGTLGAGADILDVTGTIDTGAGSFELGADDDTLILNDGADLTGLTNALDGGTHNTGDTVLLNNAGALTFGAGGTVNFEFLRKDNIGEATLTGAHSFTGGTTVNGGTLTVAGSLETPSVTLADNTVFDVGGMVQGVGGGETVLVGSAGTNTVEVGAGGLLLATGDLGDGADVLDLQGALNTGAGVLSLGGGDDTFRVYDSSAMFGTVDGGAGNDLLDVNVGAGNLVPLGSMLGFESLGKSGDGTLQINGPSSFVTVDVMGGTLQVSPGATVSAQDTTIASGATLQVEGSYAGTTGDDTMTVAGTITGNGTVALLDGNDRFTLQDGGDVSGLATPIDGGAGIDEFIADVGGTATLGGAVNFETLTKAGTGVLDVAGPGTSDFSTINVNAGVLNVGVGAVVAAPVGGSLATTIATGATLNVDGSFGCGDGNDTMSVAGTVSGSGTVDMCGGDDTLTINDGAVLANVISGGTQGAGDTVVLNNANALSFDAASTTDFEFLRKDNTGVATLTGAQSFTGGTAINGGTLSVADSLETPSVTMGDDTVLNVGGTLQAVGGGEASITGSAGVNTVTVDAGGLLRATGDLGDGNDVLDVAGTLDTGTGTFELGAGDDLFVIHDTTTMLGVVHGGDGNDMLDVDVSAGNLVPLGSMLGFESLGKSGDGTLQINGPSEFITVDVFGGTLDVAAGGSVSAQTTTVFSGATLQVDGSYSGTGGDDTMTVAGTVTGSGTVALLDGNDTFTIQDGADLSGLSSPVDGGAGTDEFVADLAGTATLGGAINFETLTKTNTGTLHIDGPAPSSFDTVNVDGGTLDVGIAGNVTGVASTTVATDATLNVDGLLAGSTGNDIMDVSGAVSGSGLIAFDAGDDILTLHDGADFSGFGGTLDGGAHGSGDTIVLDNAQALTFGAGTVSNFEVLSKQNSGTATLTGNHEFAFRTELLGGSLVVQDSLTTPLVIMDDDTALTVDGSLQGGVGTAAVVAGSEGSNVVTINGTALATGDLGGGADVLDVVGMLDTGGGMFQLGDGDDTFAVHDGTVVSGTIDGGAGLDTRVYDINGTADLGALLNFEGVTKTGTGTLNINGPVTTELQAVDVLGGTLHIGAGGNVAAVPGMTLATTVGAGATLNVDGSFGCGDGNDTMSVAGTVSGSGTVDMCGGDDTLTINDGAVLASVISGGTQGAGDTVVLNNANALSFDAASTTDFEFLRKDNTGVATLTGAQSFTGGTAINGGTLSVADSLETPSVTMGDNTVLNVGGTLQAVGGGEAAITGSAGVNTVTVDAGGLLRATGDLGAGNDVLDVAGTLDTGTGTFELGAGDDLFVIHDTTTMLGVVHGGDGNDMLDVDVSAGNLVPLGSMLGFESLGKSGDGTLQINGPSEFITVDVFGGTLEVAAGGSVSAQTTSVFSGATLQVDGSYSGTSGDDTMTVAGTVTGSGTVALLDGNDTFTIQDGADLSGLSSPVDGGAGTDEFVADLAGTATLGGAINFETLTKTNTGTLHVDGPAPSSFDTVNVDGGTLDVGAGGSLAGVQHTTVSMGSTLHVDGSFAGTSGSDLMEIAGTIAGSGTVALAEGDDRMVLMQGADLGGLATPIDGGAGTDEITAQVDTTMTLGSTVNFETLQKTGTGTLTLEGNQSYVTTHIDQGTLEIASGTTLASQNTTVSVGGTLDVQGTFTGTDGNDNFLSMGRVVGALDLGLGDDRAHFMGGDLSGLTGVAGGAGQDVLSFSALQLGGDDFDTLSGWERVELLSTTSLTTSTALNLGTGVLAIDNTSQWIANAGSSLTGNIENAGLINVGGNRLDVSGNYAGDNGAISLSLSLAGQTSGGLNVNGDVTGTTSVVFNTDGTEVPSRPASILVISSPNDNRATAGSFVVSGSNPNSDFIRLDGSVHPWTFGQEVDNNWYLSSAADGLLPEISGYAILPSAGRALSEQGSNLVHDRMSGIREDGTPVCGASDDKSRRAGAALVDDCHGFWVAGTASELEMGANPGFEFSGDSVGLYAGVDAMLSDENGRSFRGGLFAGFQRGDYWTTGANSTELPGLGEANVRIDAPSAGMYASTTWRGGTYLDLTLTGQVPQATIIAEDGFNQTLSGNSLALSARIGHSFRIGNGWVLEPQLQIGGNAVHWDDTTDASGKQLAIDDDVVGTARANLRMEKTFATANGGTLRPWLSLGIQNTFGEKENGLSVALPGPNDETETFPGHDAGSSASIDLGVEAKLRDKIDLFGAVSYSREVEGTDQEQRAINLGVRLRW